MGIIPARAWIKTNNEPEIESTGVDCTHGFEYELLRKLKDIAIQAIQTKSTYDAIAEYIHDELYVCDSNCKWHIFAFSRNRGQSRVSADQHYVWMSFGELIIEVFSTNTAHEEKLSGRDRTTKLNFDRYSYHNWRREGILQRNSERDEPTNYNSLWRRPERF